MDLTITETVVSALSILAIIVFMAGTLWSMARLSARLDALGEAVDEIAAQVKGLKAQVDALQARFDEHLRVGHPGEPGSEADDLAAAGLRRVSAGVRPSGGTHPRSAPSNAL